MASMDVTPQELRDIEIREAWRGYHRDDVDELLERAAATIEHLEDETRQLKARVSQGRAPAAAPQPAAPARVPAAAPAAVAASSPAVRTSETDVIQRTLVLAQKAADEAVAEARAKAQQMLDESESKAEQLVAEAEDAARRIADKERGKLEQELTHLSEMRKMLTADVDALERFGQEYRERLRHAIEAELELLGSTALGGAQRPAISDVDLPASISPVATWSASQEQIAPAPAAALQASASSVQIEGVQAYAEPGDSGPWPEPAGGWDAPEAIVAESVEQDEPELGDHEDTGQHENLDDDAFFASLREAVRDESPLGGDDDATDFFDQPAVDDDEERKLFRRRR